MSRCINIITALLGFAAAYALGGAILPLLKRMRFADIPDTADANGRNVPVGGGVVIGAAALAAAAVGTVLTRVFSDPLSFDTEGFSEYTAGLVISIAAMAAGFYSDRLKVSGRAGGLDRTGRAAVYLTAAAAFAAVLYSSGGRQVIDIPFYGEADLGMAYYPVIGAYMVLVTVCAGSTDNAEGVMPAVSTACFIGSGGLLADCGAGIYSIFCAGAAGSCAGFLRYGFPPAKLFCGDTGRFFLGTAMAFVGAASGQLSVMLIMLLPCGIDFIISLILKARHRKFSAGRYFAEEKGVKKGAVVIIYFTAAVIISAVISAVYYAGAA